MSTVKQQANLQRIANERKRLIHLKTRTRSMENQREGATWYGQSIIRTYLKPVSDKLTGLLKTKPTTEIIHQHQLILEQYKPILQLLTTDVLAHAILFAILSNISAEPIPYKPMCYKIGWQIIQEINYRILSKGDQTRRRFKRYDLKLAKYLSRVANKYGVKLVALPSGGMHTLGEMLLRYIFGSPPPYTTLTPAGRKLAADANKKYHQENNNLIYFGCDTMTQSNRCVTVIKLTPKWITKVKKSISAFDQHLVSYYPMIIPPVKVDKTNLATGYGYLTRDHKGQLIEGRRLALVKNVPLRYYERLANVDLTTIYNAVNKLGSVPYVINHELLEFQRSIQLGEVPNIPLNILPQPITLEPPIEPSSDADKEEWRCYRYRHANLEYEQEVVRLQWATACTYISIINTVKSYTLYFPVQCDIRGRMYPVPSPNIQATDWLRALFCYEQAYSVDLSQLHYLKIWIANLFKECPNTGESVAQFNRDNKLMWFDQEIAPDIENIATDPANHRQWTLADKPFSALVACQEYEALVNKKRDTTRLRIDIDLVCSAIQIIALLFRDKELGSKVNLASPNECKRQDIYSEMARYVEMKLRKMVAPYKASGHSLEECAIEYAKDQFLKKHDNNYAMWLTYLNQFYKSGREYYSIANRAEIYNIRDNYHRFIAANSWLEVGVTRSLVKRPTMTFGFSAKAYGMKVALYKDKIKPLFDEEYAKYAKLFPNREAAAYLLADIVYKGMQDLAPLVVAFMNHYQQQIVAILHSYSRTEIIPAIALITPHNLKFVQDHRTVSESSVLKSQTQIIKLNAKDETYRTLKHKDAICPNIVHMYDAALAQSVVSHPRLALAPLSCNHDCFGSTLPFLPVIEQTIKEMIIQLFFAQSVSCHGCINGNSIKTYQAPNHLALLHEQLADNHYLGLPYPEILTPTNTLTQEDIQAAHYICD